jgi:VanZ family protein
MSIIYLWLPVIGWAAGIFYLSSIPGLSTGLDYDLTIRKFAHVGEYFVLTFLLYRAIKGTIGADKPRLMLYPALISYLYALSDEYHQSYVLFRQGSFSDTLIDVIGIIGFYLFLSLLEKKSKK